MPLAPAILKLEPPVLNHGRCKALYVWQKGALLIRIGFWGILHYIIVIRSSQKSIGDFLGP